MNQASSSTPVRKPRRWRRRLLLTLMLLVVLGVGGILYYRWYSFHDLNAVMAEMDVQDPGWRIQDIEANRKAVPDAGNSALRILAIGKLLAGQPIITPALGKSVENLPPEVQLNEQQSAYLERRFANLSTAVVEARKLKDMPHGRYPIKYTDDCVSTPVPHLWDVREVCELLSWDAARRAHANDDDGALESCLALQNAAHSMGDEPFPESLFSRVGCTGIAVRAIERTLAQAPFTPTSEPTLKFMQETFAGELTKPTLWIALRGQRGGLHQFVQSVAEGKIDATSIGLVPGARTIDIFERLPGGRRGKRSIGNEVDARLTEHFPGFLARQQAAMLRFAYELVRAAKLSPKEADARYQALEMTIRAELYLVRITAFSFLDMGEADRRMHANLRCAVAALAAERYRLAQNRWPESLDVLA